MKLPWHHRSCSSTTSRWFVKYWYVLPLFPLAIWLLLKLIRLNKTRGLRPRQDQAVDPGHRAASIEKTDRGPHHAHAGHADQPPACRSWRP